MSPILEDRLEALSRFSLGSGSHASLDDGICAMEAVAYISGEPWSDHPQCVCPTLGAFFRSWNDGLPSDAERDRLLKPFLPRLVGTRGTPALAEARGYLALDWIVRVYTPTWLELRPELRSHAQALRALEALRDTRSVIAAQAPLDFARQHAAAARDAAWDAARAAARDAARDAARAAAWAAARDAAWAAAWDAAWDAARDAAWDAARAAAWDAAWAAAWAAAWDAARAGDAARAALRPTVAALQASASDLADRMIVLTDADLAVRAEA